VANKQYVQVTFDFTGDKVFNAMASPLEAGNDFLTLEFDNKVKDVVSSAFAEQAIKQVAAMVSPHKVTFNARLTVDKLEWIVYDCWIKQIDYDKPDVEEGFNDFGVVLHHSAWLKTGAYNGNMVSGI
jgi:hypothetical protein